MTEDACDATLSNIDEVVVCSTEPETMPKALPIELSAEKLDSGADVSSSTISALTAVSCNVSSAPVSVLSLLAGFEAPAAFAAVVSLLNCVRNVG